MDDYDTKSLSELQQIARTKHDQEIPENYSIDAAIEFLRAQDEWSQYNEATAEITVLPGSIPRLNIIQELPSIPGLGPATSGQQQVGQQQVGQQQELPLIPGFGPGTLQKFPSRQQDLLPPVPKPGPMKFPTIPKLSGLIKPKMAALPIPQVEVEPQYLLNDERTLTRLFGQPFLPWATDLGTIHDAQDQSNLLPINPRAVFQKRQLHPTYQPVVPRLQPFTFSNLPRLLPSHLVQLLPSHLFQLSKYQFLQLLPFRHLQLSKCQFFQLVVPHPLQLSSCRFLQLLSRWFSQLVTTPTF